MRNEVYRASKQCTVSPATESYGYAPLASLASVRRPLLRIWKCRLSFIIKPKTSRNTLSKEPMYRSPICLYVQEMIAFAQ